jgi:Putative amidoligase enzyme
VVAPGYRPDLAGLASDYLAANPTRDRGLDLLPVLLHLDPARVRARLPREKVGARPALHYRLPRARVGEPGWGIAPAWAGWAAVERLAGDPDRLAALGRAHPGQGRAAGGGRGARAQARPRPGPPADPADHRRGDAPSPAPAFIAREDRKAGPRRGPPWADHRAATSSNERSRAAWS